MILIYNELQKKYLFNSKSIDNLPERIHIYSNIYNEERYNFSTENEYTNYFQIKQDTKRIDTIEITQKPYDNNSNILNLDKNHFCYFEKDTKLNIVELPYSIIFDFNNKKYKIRIHEMRFENLKGIIKGNEESFTELNYLYQNSDNLGIFNYTLLLFSEIYCYNKIFFYDNVFSHNYLKKYHDKFVEGLKINDLLKNDLNAEVLRTLKLLNITSEHRKLFSIELLLGNNEEKFTTLQNPLLLLNNKDNLNFS